MIAEGQSQQAPLASFLQSIIGGNSTTTNQALAPVIGNITAGTNSNREKIFDTTAPGAGRDVLLGQNQLSQGTQVASATNQTFLSAFPELASLAGANTQAGLGLTGAGITSLSNSASTTGSVLNSQEQQKAATLNVLDSAFAAAGQGAGLAASGCWIAEAIYGVDDWKTHTVRAYLNGPFREHRLGRFTMVIYCGIGRQVAWVARRSSGLRRVLKPVFDIALARAVKEANNG